MTNFAEPVTRRSLAAALLLLALFVGAVGGFLHLAQASTSHGTDSSWTAEGSVPHAHAPHACAFCIAGLVLDLSVAPPGLAPGALSASSLATPFSGQSPAPHSETLQARAPPPARRTADRACHDIESVTS